MKKPVKDTMSKEKPLLRKFAKNDPDEKFKASTLLKILIYIGPFMVGFILFTLYPFINAFLMSFKNNFSILTGKFDGWGFENYAKVFADSKFKMAILVTLKYVVIVVPTCMVLTIIVAVLLNNTKFMQAFYQTAYFLPLVTSTAAISLVFRFIFSDTNGVLNHLLMNWGWIKEPIRFLGSNNWSEVVLYIFSIWNLMPFTVILLLSGLQNIDPQYHTAARVDGAKTLRIFFDVTLPLLAPTIALTLIVNSISAFKVFDHVFQLFNNPGPGNNLYTIIYYIYYKMGNGKNNPPYRYGQAAAASIVLFGIIALFTALQKLVQKKTEY